MLVLRSTERIMVESRWEGSFATEPKTKYQTLYRCTVHQSERGVPAIKVAPTSKHPNPIAFNKFLTRKCPPDAPSSLYTMTKKVNVTLAINTAGLCAADSAQQSGTESHRRATALDRDIRPEGRGRLGLLRRSSETSLVWLDRLKWRRWSHIQRSTCRRFAEE